MTAVGTDYASLLMRVCLISEESSSYHPRMASTPRVLLYSSFPNAPWVEQLKNYLQTPFSNGERTMLGFHYSRDAVWQPVCGSLIWSTDVF